MLDNAYAVRVMPHDLKPGMVLAVDVLGIHGELAVKAHTVLTTTLIRRILISGAVSVYVHSKKGDVNEDRIIETDISIKKTLLEQELTNVVEKGEVNHLNMYQMVIDAMDVASKTGGINKYLKLLQAKTEYTYTHCMSVSILTNLFGKWLKLTESEIYDLTVASTLHDIGKLSVDIDLIEKPGKLDHYEFVEMKKHVTNGSEILQRCDVADHIITAVEEHHERLDGSGYPYNKTRDEITTFGNILAIADVYDALVSKRSYRDALSPFTALDILRKEKFHSFHFYLVENFIDNIVNAFMGAHVILSDGRSGEIVFINPDAAIRPYIRIEGGEIINLYNIPHIRIDRVL